MLKGERFLNFGLSADAEGEFDIVYRHGGEEITKKVMIGEKTGRLTPVRTASPWGMFFQTKDPILYFGEGILPASSFVQTVYLEYKPAPLGPFGGGEITIMLIFVVVSLVFGFALKGYFGVEI